MEPALTAMVVALAVLAAAGLSLLVRRGSLGLGPLLRGLALLGGLGLLAFVASRSDPAEVWRGLLALGPWGALAVCAVFFLAFLVDTLSWQLMLPSLRLRPLGLYRLWKIRMVGEALNQVVPAGTLGGEPAKAVLLKKLCAVGYREGGASLIMAKTVNLLALLLFAGIGLVLLLGLERLPARYGVAAAAGLGALALGVAGFYAVQRCAAASRLAGWLARRRLGRPLSGLLETIEAIDGHFARFYRGQPGRFSGAFGLALLNWLLGAAEILVIMWFLGRPVGLGEAWIIETVAQLARAGAFFIPAGLGATEGAFVLLYGALFGAPALGLVVALVRRGRELLWIAWGLVWFGPLAGLAAATARAAQVPVAAAAPALARPVAGPSDRR